MENVSADRRIDCRGMLCPMPLMKTSREMKAMAPGEVLEVVATDRGSIVDLPAWAGDTGNELLGWREDGKDIVFVFRKGEDEGDR
jgi:TusA-related sulfurtransferase